MKKYNRAIIVLTNGMRSNLASLSGWKSDLTGHIRVLAGSRLYWQSRTDDETPCILFSGGRIEGSKNPGLAEILGNLASLKYHIPSEDIYLENQSIDTTENAEFSKTLLASLNIVDNLTLVTSRFHSKRARTCFKIYGLEPDVVCAEAIVSEISARHKAFLEVYSRSEYNLTLTLKNIAWHAYLRIAGPEPFRKHIHNQIDREGRRAFV